LVVLSCWAAELHHSHSLTPLPQRKRGKKYDEKGSRNCDKDREITQQLSSWTKHMQHREINIICCLSLADYNSEKLKANLKPLLPPIHPALPPPAECCRGMGDVGCGQSLTLSPNTTSLTLHHLLLLHGPSLPLFHVGSLPRDAVLPEMSLRGLLTGHHS